MMGAVIPLHPESDLPLLLADAEIRWAMRTYDWREIEPVLRLGGARGLAQRLRGLCDLLKPHDALDEDEIVFLRTWLSDLATALYVGDDDESLCGAVIVRAAEASGPPPASEDGA
jgi:hypothetical protein